MSITWQDLEKIGAELKEKTEEFNRRLIEQFKGADYERGDKILISSLLAKEIHMKHPPERIIVSKLLKGVSYVVIPGKKKKQRIEWSYQALGLPVLKEPVSIISHRGA